jgi:hypothetical protein
MRKPTYVNITKSYELKAKSLKKGDPIWVGKRSFRVSSNKKNDLGQRVIRLKWGSNKKKDSALIIVPPSLLFRVTKHKHIHTK